MFPLPLGPKLARFTVPAPRLRHTLAGQFGHVPRPVARYGSAASRSNERRRGSNLAAARSTRWWRGSALSDAVDALAAASRLRSHAVHRQVKRSRGLERVSASVTRTRWPTFQHLAAWAHPADPGHG